MSSLPTVSSEQQSINSISPPGTFHHSPPPSPMSRSSSLDYDSEEEQGYLSYLLNKVNQKIREINQAKEKDSVLFAGKDVVLFVREAGPTGSFHSLHLQSEIEIDEAKTVPPDSCATKTAKAAFSFFENPKVKGMLLFIAAATLGIAFRLENYPLIYVCTAAVGYFLQAVFGPALDTSSQYKPPPPAPPLLAEPAESNPSQTESLPQEDAPLLPPPLANSNTIKSLIGRACSLKVAKAAYNFFTTHYSIEIHGTVSFLAAYYFDPTLIAASGLLGMYIRNQLCHMTQYFNYPPQNHFKPSDRTSLLAPTLYKIIVFTKNHAAMLSITGLSAATLIAMHYIPFNENRSSQIKMVQELCLVIIARLGGHLVNRWLNRALILKKYGKIAQILVKVASVLTELPSITVALGYLVAHRYTEWGGYATVGFALGNKDYSIKDYFKIDEAALPEADLQNVAAEIESIRKRVWLFCCKNWRLILEGTQTAVGLSVALWQGFSPNPEYLTLILGTGVTHFYVRKGMRYSSRRFNNFFGKVARKYVLLTDRCLYDLIVATTYMRDHKLWVHTAVVAGICLGTFREMVSTKNARIKSYERNEVALAFMALK